MTSPVVRATARLRPPRPAERFRYLGGALGLALGLGACSAPPPPPPPPPPPIDSEQVLATLERVTALEQPTRILFEWSLNEQGTRVRGRGVARIEPPFRARLDLFTGNGETVARAALVDDELRIPPGVPEGIIPPAHLLWTALGVFRPGTDAAFLGAEREEGERISLRYRYANGQELRYHLAGRSIVEAELLEGGHTVQRVSLERGAEGSYPEEATYRNLTAFRELTLTRQTVENVEFYPPDIWFPTR